MLLCLVNTGVLHEQNKISSRCRGGIILTEPWGIPIATFFSVLAYKICRLPRFQIVSVRKEAISLMRLVENSNSIYVVGQGTMLCQRLSHYPVTQQPSAYYC
jgi:hypothetical protein